MFEILILTVRIVAIDRFQILSTKDMLFKRHKQGKLKKKEISHRKTNTVILLI